MAKVFANFLAKTVVIPSEARDLARGIYVVEPDCVREILRCAQDDRDCVRSLFLETIC
jgi:hypothetical protein